jgi:hypothetical protein
MALLQTITGVAPVSRTVWRLAVKTPRPTLFDDCKPRLIVAVKQLVSDSAAGIFIGQFECLGTEPLDINNRDKAVREDATHRCIRLEVFELHQASSLQLTFVLEVSCVPLRSDLLLYGRGGAEKDYQTRGDDDALRQR